MITDIYMTKAKISIHAPAKGATSMLLRCKIAVFAFQSTLPRRERRRYAGRRLDICNFNPRSREGSDSEDAFSVSRMDDFNPRSREGSDSFMALKSLLNIISIHAPAKGATWSGCRRQLGIQFQSTLPRRERLTNSIHRVCYTQISIHAPAKGATG